LSAKVAVEQRDKLAALADHRHSTISDVLRTILSESLKTTVR